MAKIDEPIAPYKLVMSRTTMDSYLEYKGERLPGLTGAMVAIGELGIELGRFTESTVVLFIPAWRVKIEFEEESRPAGLFEPEETESKGTLPREPKPHRPLAEVYDFLDELRASSKAEIEMYAKLLMEEFEDYLLTSEEAMAYFREWLKAQEEKNDPGD